MTTRHDRSFGIQPDAAQLPIRPRVRPRICPSAPRELVVMRRRLAYALLLGAGAVMGWHTQAIAAPALTQLAQEQPAPAPLPAPSTAPAATPAPATPAPTASTQPAAPEPI